MERVWKTPSEFHRLRSTRLLVVVFALIAAVLALDPPGGIVELTAFSGALYGACFLPTMIFGLYTKRTNGAMVMTSMVTGAAVLLLWQRIAASTGIHQVFPAIAASFLGYLSAAAASRSSIAESTD